MSRTPVAPYFDPLNGIWLAAAERIGLRIERSEEVFASTDGQGNLTLASSDLDPDDCLAQMIFHELCHSLVEGPESLDRADWGLDNETDVDVPREHACLRVQAALAAPLGLRWFLAPTTDHRAFYDALPDDPLAPADDATSVLARAGLARAARPPWGPALQEALAATEQVVQAAARAIRAAQVAGDTSLYDTVDAPWPVHPTGFRVPPYGTPWRCGDCAWRAATGECRQSRAVVGTETPSCERWEPSLDCLACGACCRAAYHAVELSPDESIVRLRPELIVQNNGITELKRSGDRCAALAASAPYTCDAYEHRPETCRNFAVSGEHCLTARRRVGLSR